ncbi:peroxisomal multifunctional enzyme type 2-like isoform X2 [Babylonia areolata]|uniref:peroxisomal multifunctional enzyme type 2-like isoform X1 n=1 Tax=Babylonia areolata TaxID=304850 RepID=UPI003FD1273B
MASPMRFDGQVALVTGAGNGLGRAYALALAERGASVVVNDLGGDIKGLGKSSRAADLVVSEIQAKGGKAVANYDSVEEGEKLVQTALENFGRIDIVINNAGILRDRSFARISNDDWDIIQRVHLRGSFLVTRAAWPHMKKQNYGRIIMTTSTSGIYGNFGQANYAAAKSGLIGLSNTLAVEGEKNNILCNAVAPVAGSRLASHVMPPDVAEGLKMEYNVPLVLYLVHESCPASGDVFEMGGGWVAQTRHERSKGAVIRTRDSFGTPEAVRDNWDKITDFTDSEKPRSGNMVGLMEMLNKFQEEEATPSSAQDSAGGSLKERIEAFQPDPTSHTFTDRDVILYALGVGVSTQQDDHLRFLFEHSEDFTTLPTFAVIPAFKALSSSLAIGIPGFPIDLTKVLHGEQYLELYKPFPTSGTLTSTVRVKDILDKGSGAFIVADVETVDEQGDPVAFNQLGTFVVGSGKFGGPRTSPHAKLPQDPPSRTPDASVSEKTSVDQAALYRLSGDRNPLHIDPSFAAMGGFAQPILHGLSSFGFAVRHVMKTYANNDMTKFKAVKVRFSKPVLPGQTLQTDMWKDGSRVFFRTKVVENGNVCITGAYVDLREDTSPAESQSSGGGQLQSTAVFQQMAAEVKKRPDLPAKVNAVFLWNITKDGNSASKWTVDLKGKGAGGVYQGEPLSGKADCTLTVSDDVFMALHSGKLAAQQAFMQGKLKLAGNIMLAQKLGELLNAAKQSGQSKL